MDHRMYMLTANGSKHCKDVLKRTIQKLCNKPNNAKKIIIVWNFNLRSFNVISVLSNASLQSTVLFLSETIKTMS